MEHIVIIGNGISGVTAARHIRKRSDSRITIVSAETEHFFSRTALMYIYMGHMKYEHTKPYEDDFWEKNDIELVFDKVLSIDFEAKALQYEKTGFTYYDKLVLAVGSKPNKFGWPGQDLDGVGGLFSYQDLEHMEEYTKGIKRGVIIGGGLIGIEMAEMLLSRGIEVTFLVREKGFWSNVLPKGESELVARHMRKHHVDLRLGEELKEVLSDENGRARAVITSTGEEIECGWVGLTAGVSPNVDFLKSSDLEIDRGILVNQYLETNQPGVYAIGDCAQFKEPVAGRRPMEQVWYTGKIMGKAVAATICGEPTKYAPGHWYNSAKFFDIEYQTYGWVFAQLREGEKSFYWEHENEEICMHFVYNESTRKFIGVNTFGIRLRHEMFDKWLREEATVEQVLEHLKDANFDPELYAQYEKQIVAKFNKENGTSLEVKKKSWKRILESFKK